MSAIVTVQNDGLVTDRFKFSVATSGGTQGGVVFTNDDVTVKDVATGADVSAAVRAGTFQTPVIYPGSTRKYKVTMTAPVGIAPGTYGGTTIKMYSATQPSSTEDRLFLRGWVQGISKLQYSLDDKDADDATKTWTDVPQEGQAGYPLTVAQGSYVDFKAIKVLPTQEWPNGTPEWSGSAGALGVGDTKHVDFGSASIPSVGEPDLKTVVAECGIPIEGVVHVAGSPDDLIVLTSGSGKMTLYWDKVPGATGYYVYRSSTSGGQDYSQPIDTGSSAQISYVGGNIYMFTEDGLTNGSEYFYTVKAIYPNEMLSEASIEESDICDPNGIPWDSQNATQILNAATQLANASVKDGDNTITTTDQLNIVAPDGVVYRRDGITGSDTVTLPEGYMNEDGSLFTSDDGSTTTMPGADTLTDGSGRIGPRSIPDDLESPYRGAITTAGYQSAGIDIKLGTVNFTRIGKAAYGPAFNENAYICLGSHWVHPGTNVYYHPFDSGLIRQESGTGWRPFVLTLKLEERLDPQNMINYVYTPLSPNPKYPDDPKRRLNRNFIVGSTGTTFPDGTQIHEHLWVAMSSIPTGTKHPCTFNKITGGGKGVVFGLPMRRRKATTTGTAVYRLHQLAQGPNSTSAPPTWPNGIWPTHSSMVGFDWTSGRVSKLSEQGSHAWGTDSSDIYQGIASRPPAITANGQQYTIVSVGPNPIFAYHETNVSITLP